MMTREERQAARTRRAAMIEAHQTSRNGDNTPAATVAELVKAVGYDVARQTVAELVNSVGSWDGRISRRSREFAASVADALTCDQLETAGIYTPAEIHAVHIDQIAEAMSNYTPAEEAQEEAQEEAAPSIFERMTAELEARADRSAWNKGVTVYALELVESLEERAAYEGRNPEPGKECREWLLNGAQDWQQYSWGGSALIYDGDIAERLCTPSELKKTRNDERRPNSREEWLDTQARALFQACNRVIKLYRAVKEG